MLSIRNKKPAWLSYEEIRAMKRFSVSSKIRPSEDVNQIVLPNRRDDHDETIFAHILARNFISRFAAISCAYVLKYFWSVCGSTNCDCFVNIKLGGKRKTQKSAFRGWIMPATRQQWSVAVHPFAPLRVADGNHSKQQRKTNSRQRRILEKARLWHWKQCELKFNSIKFLS